MKKIRCLLLLLLAVNCLYAQVKTRSYVADPELAVRERVVDFTSLSLKISFEPEKGLVKGDVKLSFTTLRQSTDSIWLDGIRMQVKSLMLNGKPAKYKADSTGITVYPTNQLGWHTDNTMEVVYECHPRKGLYFIGWDDPTGKSRKQIWSQGEGTDNRNWIPCFDDWNDKLLTETIVTFDTAYKVLSNGTQVSIKNNGDGTRTWHYKMTHPQAPYLIMLGIGKYDIENRTTKSGVPLHLYYYPDWRDRMLPTYKYSAEMVDFYDQEIGVPYGWESYSQIPVQDFMYGAMENTTATIYGDFFLVDERGFLDRNYIAVNAHELAHQWFGDMVTCRSDASMWLHENFATYYSGLFDLHQLGEDVFDLDRRGWMNAAIDQNKKDQYPIASSMGGGTRNYPQGAFVLSMLKYVVGGRDMYNAAIKHYLEQHKYQNVETRDLQVAFEEATGMSLDWFWQEWYWHSGQPAYDVQFEEGKGSTWFTVSQVQELSELSGLPASADGRAAGLFKMPIWFEVHYTDGSADKKQAWIEKQQEKVEVLNASGKAIDYVLFDPSNIILKTVTFSKPFAMLRSQALKAEHLQDRMDAVEAMKSIDIATKRATLIQVYNKEHFHAVKEQVVAQLINDENADSRALIKSALKDKDAAVRKAALANQAKIPSDLLPDYEQLLSDSSYDVVSGTLSLLYNSNPGKMQQYLDKTKGIIGCTGQSVEIKWLELSAITSPADASFYKRLTDLTSNAYEFRTRVAAMQALKRLDYFDKQLLANLVNAVFSSNARLSGPAADVLQYYYGQDKIKAVISSYIKDGSWENWQTTALKKALN
jgi:aminopeptidase N